MSISVNDLMQAGIMDDGDATATLLKGYEEVSEKNLDNIPITEKQRVEIKELLEKGGIESNQSQDHNHQGGENNMANTNVSNNSGTLLDNANHKVTSTSRKNKTNEGANKDAEVYILKDEDTDRIYGIKIENWGMDIGNATYHTFHMLISDYDEVLVYGSFQGNMNNNDLNISYEIMNNEQVAFRRNNIRSNETYLNITNMLLQYLESFKKKANL